MIHIITDGNLLTELNKDASLIKGFKRDSYALELKEDGKSLYMIAPMNGVITLVGDKELAKTAVSILWSFNLKLGGATGEASLVEEFTKEYIAYTLGSAAVFSKNGNEISYLYKEGFKKRALLAGGCFWCAARPYYGVPGIEKITVGYAGGEELNPSYLDVKKQLTHHKESVLVEYDSRKIDYVRIIDLFFENIDPFDDGGQFIDRGDSYTTAVFTSDKEERMVVIEYKYQLSDECERECKVALLESAVFFTAEEEHQDYAIKNPKEMEEELIASGRLIK